MAVAVKWSFEQTQDWCIETRPAEGEREGVGQDFPEVDEAAGLQEICAQLLFYIRFYPAALFVVQAIAESVCDSGPSRALLVEAEQVRRPEKLAKELVGFPEETRGLH